MFASQTASTACTTTSPVTTVENCQVEKEEDEAETAVDEGALGLDLLLSERDRMDEETRNARGPVTRTAPAKRR